MNITRFASAVLCIALAVSSAQAQSDAAVGPNQELDAVVAEIQQKLRSGEKSRTELAPHVAALDALRLKYADHPETAAKITLMEYSLCRDVLKDNAKAAELRAVLTTKYRKFIEGTQVGQQVAMQENMEKARVAQAALVGKPAPEITFRWSTQSGLTKLSDLKGKVVVLDFWATWCGPCIATFPQIRELVEHYKDASVVVIGVTSVQGFVMGLEPARIDTKGDPEREFTLMGDFIKAKNMTWPVAFAEQPVFNPDYGVMGIPHMAIIGPDGIVRHNGLHPSMPHTKKVTLIDALLPDSDKRPAGRSGDQ